MIIQNRSVWPTLFLLNVLLLLKELICVFYLRENTTFDCYINGVTQNAFPSLYNISNILAYE